MNFKDILTKLGQNNKPTYAVMAIALVKGIARPTFTMMDKHENPETKKYTAIREGLTEVVAIPTYWACGEMAAKVADKLNLAPEKKALAKHNFMFLGVCTAALFAIPALTSLIIKPVMKKIQSNKKKIDIDENIHKLDIKEIDEEDIFDDDREIVNRIPLKQNDRPLGAMNYTSGRVADMKVGALW